MIEWIKTLDDAMYTYDPNKYQVKTTPFTKPKARLTELVSNKPPINIPTVKDLVTEKAGAKGQPIIIKESGKTEKEPINPKPDRKNKDTSSRMPMKKESWVMDLQKTINAETGANLVEDGKWGPKTEAAYKVYAGKINDSKNSAQSAPPAQLPDEGLAATVAPKELGFWERLFQDDRTPEQKAAELQAAVDDIGRGKTDVGYPIGWERQ